jgi:methyl-accepting chemotaxis protein
MLRSFSIKSKMMIGVGAMALIIGGFVIFCFIQLNISFRNISELKTFIHEQATNGSSQILVQNVMRRELLSKQYLFDGNERNTEIIGLLENEFSTLSSDLLAAASGEEKASINAVVAENQRYQSFTHEQLWQVKSDFEGQTKQLNEEVGPKIEKQVLSLIQSSSSQNNGPLLSAANSLYVSLLKTRNYFNNFLISKGTAKFQLVEDELSYLRQLLGGAELANIDGNQLAQLISGVDEMERLLTSIMAINTQLIEFETKSGADATSIARQIMSNQIARWRDLDYQTGIVQAFISTLRWQTAISLFIAVLAGGIFLYFIAMSVVKNLNHVLDRIKDLSEGDGDLTKRVECQSRDEIYELSESLNQFIVKLQNIISQTQSRSGLVMDNSVKNLEYSGKTRELLSQQEERTDKIASSMEEMSVSAKEVAENSSSSKDVANNAIETLDEGINIVDKSINSINGLNTQIGKASEVIQSLAEESESIGKVVDVIKVVTEQTNLLALNAAIEAARAGEAGRGFAVVADEVRSLASKTQQSATEIEQIIGHLQRESRKAVDAVEVSQEYANSSADTANQAYSVFEKIKHSMDAMQDITNLIATAAEQQSVVASNINLDVAEVTQFSQDMSKTAQQSYNKSQESSEGTTELNNLLAQFKV